ncbi:MAG: Zn-dependent hydrolase [Bacteroidales bacterium]|nr:MAG: Zn-dependent hydrolase [Bacteroidales bacterium]
MRKIYFLPSLFLVFLVWSCGTKQKQENVSEMQKKVDEYVKVDLTSNISHLTDKEKQILPLLFEVAQIMDNLYWEQAYGDKTKLLNSITDDATREFVLINYGPWDRLNGNEPFVEGVGAKPFGANFYPIDMTKEEFDSFSSANKNSLYTIVKRNAEGKLESIPYHVAYKDDIEKAAALLKKASEIAEDEGLKNYLNLRADALLTDEYLQSDLAWMDMKTNSIDFVVGPIENYEDALYNYKAAFESFILIKDMEWSQKLARFAKLLPDLQNSLPVDTKYKMEMPGSDSDLGVYDVVFYSGDCNAGSKTIAINLPNDPKVHIEKGSRKLQLKNAMQYKFDKILSPIGNILIDSSQRKHIKFDAFFENVMFHEVAHGLGIKNLINEKGSVREALKEKYSGLEEGKADILGLFMVKKLTEMGELTNKDLMDNYVTFMAGIFRSVRFGAASSHGKANMVCFYYFQENGAFTRNPVDGTYKVDFDKMTEAMNGLANSILTLQGNGDYAGVVKVFEEKGFIREELKLDLERVTNANIPKDLRYSQGLKQLGL